MNNPLIEYSVLMTFQHPAWDERNGYTYTTFATSKAQAVRNARRMAEAEGHTGVRYFTATAEHHAALFSP